MAGFYARFVPRFSQIAEPLHYLKRKNVKFIWGDPQQTAFVQLQEALTTPPVLQILNSLKEFTLVCDASDVAISAVLHQSGAEGLAPIAYTSRLLSPAERKYAIYEECLAVVYGCEKYRSYLKHKEFHLTTDNQALAWLLKQTREFGRIGCWVFRLAPFKFKVGLIKGKENVVADCLTRQFEDLPTEGAFSGLILGQLPEFQSIREHQKKDPECKGSMRKLSKEILRRKRTDFTTGRWCTIRREPELSVSFSPRRFVLWCLNTTTAPL
jgi:hypothetical protein